MTLTEFLLARIAEDEADAHAAQDGRWSWEQGFGELCNDPECPFGSLMSTLPDGTLVQIMDVHGYDVHRDWEGAAHIARHDPARVLAECEAKRRIVALHDRQPGTYGPGWGRLAGTPYGGCNSCAEDAYFELSTAKYPCETLRALAAVYADHPDYDPAWAV